MIIINKIQLVEIMKKLFNGINIYIYIYNYRNYKIRLSLHNYILVMLVRYDFVRSNSF